MGKVEYKESESMESIIQIFKDNSVNRIAYKQLSPNDNSKNQLYLGMGFDAAQVLPHEEIVDDHSQSTRADSKFKASLSFYWIDGTGRKEPAPHAQLILYPKYPEVRFSGFLAGCAFNLTDLMGVKARIPNRLMLFGITSEGVILGHVLAPDAPAAIELIERYPIDESGPALQTFNPFTTESSKSRLLSKLREINRIGWIRGCKFTNKGTIEAYSGQNAGGFTLEAQFEIIPNSVAEPDFENWELKTYTVPTFNKDYKKVITLMTPEPDGGEYRSLDLKEFMLKYGYPDRNSRKDRYNFGGVHKYKEIQALTGATLDIIGYSTEKSKIIDAGGSVVLLSRDNIAIASWSFNKLLGHWNKKHRHAAYVPSMKSEIEGITHYSYGGSVKLGEYTDFLLFLKAISLGEIYYDPGIKLEDISSTKPKSKKRNQIRIRTPGLPALYSSFESVQIG